MQVRYCWSYFRLIGASQGAFFFPKQINNIRDTGASYCVVRLRMSYRTTVSSKGQVVVPAELREQLGLRKGTAATWTEENGRLVLTPISAKLLDEIRGSLKPRPGEASAFEGCFEERARERAREK
jgi:AbrB family looped-hinge helix DNA binding protein